MREFPRPRIVISRCIEFDHCRYDGSMIPSYFVKALKPYVYCIPVCPEMEIGLGVPRETIRIVAANGSIRLIQPATGLDLTDNMNHFVRGYLSSLPEVDGFILKLHSPSCGLKDIRVYSGAEKSRAVSKGPGFFGGAVMESFSHLAVEDEGRLCDFNIREHFLTRLYVLASFREARGEGRLSSLIRFHEANKLLLSSHSQKETRMLGNILANHDGLSYTDISGQYREHMTLALARPPRSSSRANVFRHALGYFKGDLSPRQKELFLQNIQRYRCKKLPARALLAVLQSWAEEFGQEYLIGQSIFHPFPDELMELCQDSQCDGQQRSFFRDGHENRLSCDRPGAGLHPQPHLSPGLLLRGEAGEDGGGEFRLPGEDTRL